MIKIYCDGSAKANGSENNCGGAGVCALAFDNDSDESAFRIEYTWCEEYENVTNNSMELVALIEAIDLATTKYKNEKCEIYCDSAYCVNMCQDWIWTWAKNDWMNSRKKLVENINLVQNLYERLIKNSFSNYTIKKVSGHSNVIGNELADALATSNKKKIEMYLKEYGCLVNFDLQ